MFKSALISVVSVTAILALTAVPAAAQRSYSYVAAPLGTVPMEGANIATAAPASTLAVELYLREQATAATGSLISSELGLFGAGVSLTRTGVAPSSPVQIGTVAGDAGFDGTRSTTGSTASLALVNENVAPADAGGPLGTDLGGFVRLVPLGAVTLTAGSVAGQSTQFTVASFGGTGNTLTFTNGYDLDTTNNSTLTGPPVYIGATSSLFTIYNGARAVRDGPDNARHGDAAFSAEVTPAHV